MTSTRDTLRSARPEGRSAARGFSFIEVIVVMGAMAVLLGLAVGYIGNLGRSTFVQQAKAMLQETAHACLSASMGGRRAVMMLREDEDEDGNPFLMLGASIARPVITHQFETLDFASEARSPQVNGGVELDRKNGRLGNCAAFKGGHLSFPPLSVFAITEGLEYDCWVRPEARRTLMTLVKGGDAYEIALVQGPGNDTYDVRLRLKVRKAMDSFRTAPVDKTYETKGGPVIADGRWQRIQVLWQGMEPSIRVNGLEVYEGSNKTRRPAGELDAEAQAQVLRIAVGERGAVELTIGAPSNAYYGLMDSFRLLGVFQSEEFERKLPGELAVLQPKIPLRIAFYNGGLDPDIHSADQIIRIRDRRSPNDPAVRLTVGMFGTVTSDFETPSQGAVPERVPSSSDGAAGGGAAGGGDAKKEGE